MRTNVGVPARLSKFLVLLLLAGTLLTGCSYVVLGDSIGAAGRATYAQHYGKIIGVQPTVAAVDGEMLFAFEQSIMHDQPLRDSIAKADVVTVSIGSNDLDLDLIQYELWGCNPACVDAALQSFETDYTRTLVELRALTKARITVLDIYDPGPSQVDSYVIGKFLGVNEFIHHAACTHGMTAASVGEAFNGADGTGDPVALGYIASDGIHPSDLGAQVIAQAVLAAHC